MGNDDSFNNPKLLGINYNGSSGLSNLSNISNKIILDNFEELPEKRNGNGIIPKRS